MNEIEDLVLRNTWLSFEEAVIFSQLCAGTLAYLLQRHGLGSYRINAAALADLLGRKPNLAPVLH